jgi:hypothetical protein
LPPRPPVSRVSIPTLVDPPPAAVTLKYATAVAANLREVESNSTEMTSPPLTKATAELRKSPVSVMAEADLEAPAESIFPPLKDNIIQGKLLPSLTDLVASFETTKQKCILILILAQINDPIYTHSMMDVSLLYQSDTVDGVKYF